MRNLLGTVALAALVLSGGCSRTQQAQVNQQVQGARQQLSQAAADQALEAKVKTALSTRKGIDADAIDVEAHNGHVVLKGDVASREQADLAVRAAQETDGVTSVENRLTIRVPASRMPPSGASPAAPAANRPGY